jgi:hypothetical protein
MQSYRTLLLVLLCGSAIAMEQRSPEKPTPSMLRMPPASPVSLIQLVVPNLSSPVRTPRQVPALNREARRDGAIRRVVCHLGDVARPKFNSQRQLKYAPEDILDDKILPARDNTDPDTL